MANNSLNPLSWFSSQSKSKNPNREEDISKAIRKAVVMDELGDTRSRETDRLAVSTIDAPWKDDKEQGGIMGAWQNTGFRHYMAFNFNRDKVARVADYRSLAKEEKIDACLHELTISCLASHDGVEMVEAKLGGDYADKTKQIIDEELRYVINLFRFEERGQEYFKEFLTCGELVFENVFSVMKPELGILDIKAIPPENMDPIYRNQYNEEIEAFILRKPNNQLGDQGNRYFQQTRSQKHTQTFDTIPLASSQVTYCNSGEWDDTLSMSIPYITRGQDAQKKLTLIEDSIIINAMVNAPERLLWNIPTGNMDSASQARYMRNIINSHKSKKGTDQNGNILDKYDPISITEDFYIPVGSDGVSATVSRMAGSSAFGSGFNGMLDYFHAKVYEDMHVPISRLNPETAGTDGTTITMQELAFAERIIAIQKKVAAAIKKTLIVHLKLKGLKLHHESCAGGILLERSDMHMSSITDELLFEKHIELVERDYYSGQLVEQCITENNTTLLHEIGTSYWDQYELNEYDIKVVFSLPTSFMALRDQQQFDLKWTNFNTMAGSGFFSVFLLAKEHLGMTDDEILRHVEWKKKEAEKNWELGQIEEGGPEFREAQAEALGADIGGDMGSALGGDMGGTPDFGGGDMDGIDGDEEAPLPSSDSGAELDDLEEIPDEPER